MFMDQMQNKPDDRRTGMPRFLRPLLAVMVGSYYLICFVRDIHAGWTVVPQLASASRPSWIWWMGLGAVFAYAWIARREWKAEALFLLALGINCTTSGLGPFVAAGKPAIEAVVRLLYFSSDACLWLIPCIALWKGRKCHGCLRGL
jgi:hypothetical protein